MNWRCKAAEKGLPFRLFILYTTSKPGSLFPGVDCTAPFVYFKPLTPALRFGVIHGRKLFTKEGTAPMSSNEFQDVFEGLASLGILSNAV